jgi:alkylation response protein AidB-like acyl-CoA dehydrogenase
LSAPGRASDSAATLLARAASIVGALQKLAPEADAHRTFPHASFDLIREQGLLGAPFELAPGDPTLLLLLKHMGRGDLSVGRLYEGHVNALQLVQTFGAPEQVSALSARASEQGMVFAVWNTEGADGVRLVPLPHGCYRMEGSKTFASGAGNVQWAVVTGALPDGGWQMCVVPMDSVPVSIDPSWWRPSGMHASTSYKVDFTDVELQPDALLGEPGDYHRQPWFSGGAIRFAAVQLGGAEALLDETRYFLRSLDRIDDPHQRARLGEGAILIESGNLWLREAARTVDIGPDRDGRKDIDRMVNYANMTRLAIERICLDIMQLVERSVGARGLLQPWPMERIIRDLTLYLRQPAPDAAQGSVGRLVLQRDAHIYRMWRAEQD